MAAKKTKTAHTRIYNRLRGVEMGDSPDITRCSRLENMYIDREGGAGIPESIPGFRKLNSIGGKVNGIYSHKLGDGNEHLLVHTYDELYRFYLDESDDDYDMVSSLANNPSCAFTFGDSFYLFDGETMVRVNSSGGTRLGDRDLQPYVPLIIKDGKPCEERNLLTQKIRATYSISSADEYSYGTAGLKYRVTSESDATCAVTGIDTSVTGTVYIPSYHTIGDKKYRVTAIDERSFGEDTPITAVIVYPGVKSIGKYAFGFCDTLTSVILPASVEVISEYAFYNCKSLTHIRLGAGLLRLGDSAFAACPLLETVSYEGDSVMFSLIANVSMFEKKLIVYNQPYNRMKIALPMSLELDGILEVKIDGDDAEYEFEAENGRIVMNAEHRTSLEGIEVSVSATVAEGSYRKDPQGTDAVALFPNTNARGLICGCRLATIFDGRIFLSGNPACPNAVFYSSYTEDGVTLPTYFGSLDYFLDGAAGYPAVGLCAVRDSLMVFKAGDDGSGSIFSHRPLGVDGIRRTVYPVFSRMGSEERCFAAMRFGSSAIAVGASGVSEITESGDVIVKKARSGAIAPIFGRDISEVSMTEWLGYLVLCIDGRVFLGDPTESIEREGLKEYAWYPLSGIGAYENDTRVYRYSGIADEGCSVREDKVGEIAEGTVYTSAAESGSICYSEEGGARYSVYPTEEMTGGEFHPAVKFISIGKRLFFVSAVADVCVFNNDMRGVPPESVSSAEDFDAEEYKREMGGRIHPSFYSFAGHAARYAIATAWDDCDLPNVTKNAVPNSLVIKLKCHGTSSIACEVGSDGGYRLAAKHRCGRLSFDELDFTRLSLATEERVTLPVRDRAHGWCERSVSVYSDAFCSPFGLYSIAFSYTFGGRPKIK